MFVVQAPDVFSVGQQVMVQMDGREHAGAIQGVYSDAYDVAFSDGASGLQPAHRISAQALIAGRCMGWHTQCTACAGRKEDRQSVQEEWSKSPLSEKRWCVQRTSVCVWD